MGLAIRISAGSSGAVGTAAVQLIRQIGVIPLQISRNGQPDTINITEDLGPQIQEKTKGDGVAAVINTVGEATLFKKALEVLEDNGRQLVSRSRFFHFNPTKPCVLSTVFTSAAFS